MVWGKRVKYIYWVKKDLCGCFRKNRRITRQRQWNRCERGKGNRNWKSTVAFSYTRLHALSLFFVFYTYHSVDDCFYTGTMFVWPTLVVFDVLHKSAFWQLPFFNVVGTATCKRIFLRMLYQSTNTFFMMCQCCL